jgi:DNA-binding LacI/PurR family transcriptional regulator
VNGENAIRLQDIAARAGVSRATVSLALRNHASISSQTRARIHKIAEELGYRPNPLVSALMSHQRRGKQHGPKHLGLAMVINFSRDQRWQRFLSEDLLSTAAARAEQLGYHLEEFWLPDAAITPEQLSSILYRRSVPGLIIAPLPEAHGQLRMEWNHFSAVAIGYSLLNPQLHRVTTNRFQGMRLAVKHLRQLGYRRLGLALRLDQDARVDHQWGAAFAWEQQHTEAKFRTAPLVVPESDWNERNFARWFKANKPDVILAYDPEIIEWLKRLDCRVPGDVGFAHLWTPDTSGKFAGIYHNPPAIGTASVDFLVGMIQRNERGLPASSQTLLLDTSWQEGKTLRLQKGS